MQQQFVSGHPGEGMGFSKENMLSIDWQFFVMLQ